MGLTGALVPLARRPLPPGCGRKAAHLVWLAEHGFRVPEGWVVPADADLATLGSELRTVLDASTAYAVRSSADVEDGAAGSFAGQFLSLLDVGSDAAPEAVAAVRASATAPGVREYAARIGIDPDRIRMGVVIERMVRPVVSGVAFSRNPLSGLDEVVVEAIPGRGDRLMSEGETPDRWVHRWGELTERPERPRVEAGLIVEVARETRRIAAAFGRPVDLEWVHDGSTLHWVQVRPILGLDAVGIYSSRIAREVLPGLIPPLVWSVNVPVVNGAWVDLFTEAIGPNDVDPSRLARQFAWRAYFDMGRIGDIFVLLGMPRDLLELLLGLPAAGSERPRFTPSRATYRHLPRMSRLAWRLWRYEGRLRRELPAFAAAYRSFATDDLAPLDAPALVRRLESLMALHRRVAYANIATPLLMNAYGALVRRISASAGIDPATVDPMRGRPADPHDPRAAIAALAATIDALPSAARASLDRGGWQALESDPALGGVRDDLLAFVERFGHLGDSGNDFSVPRWREQPELVLRMVLATHVTPAATALGWDEVRPRLRPARRPLARIAFGRAATFRALREAVSYEFTFGYELFRGTSLALGERLVAAGRLDARDDVFLLSLDELRAEVAGDAPDPRPVVAARRADLAASVDLELPETIVGDDFLPRRRGASPASELRGVATSRGTYRGPVRVVRSTDEFDRVCPGDVLVVAHSDVAWTPLFARAGAVVAESGGMLSHSSIVAREQGIPCVVSVAGALGLPDGATVHVDGLRGLVTLESPMAAGGP